MRYRQVHLDFHTSEHIPGIGADFDPDAFAATFRAAHVDSVTCFSRCHHGWIYHDTALPYKHPHLERDLLAEQIQALHAADIRCPVYITVGWDELQARLHPEWREVRRDGSLVGAPTDTRWKKLCFGSPYLDYVAEQTREVVARFGDELDGLFFDIIFVEGAHSEWAMVEYARQGWNPERDEDVARMKAWLVDRYLATIHDAVRELNATVPLFHNSGHVGPEVRDRLRYYGHLEVESLPTGGWGYAHAPTTARYVRTLGPDWLGMTGKFSESWGHFNSYKAPAALEYECLSTLALGGRCSVGDQLHPRGALDPATYSLIGPVYAQVAAREPWCDGAAPAAEIAVVNAETVPGVGQRQNGPNLGAMRVLQEGAHQFDFVDWEADLSAYAVVILPDVVHLTEETQARLTAYLEGGGRLLSTHEGGLFEGHFTLPGFPAVYEGPRPIAPDYAQRVAGGPTYVMYGRGSRFKPTDAGEVTLLGQIPYFERSYRHFCSHAHTPPSHGSFPAGARTDTVEYLAHPLFTAYAEHAMPAHRDLVLEALDRLLPTPWVRLQGPRTVQAHVHRQDGRALVHLLHYIPERRGLRQDVVEDPMTLAGVEVSLRGAYASGRLEPQGIPLEAVPDGDRTRFVLPDVRGHTILTVSPFTI